MRVLAIMILSVIDVQPINLISLIRTVELVKNKLQFIILHRLRALNAHLVLTFQRELITASYSRPVPITILYTVQEIDLKIQTLFALVLGIPRSGMVFNVLLAFYLITLILGLYNVYLAPIINFTMGPNVSASIAAHLNFLTNRVENVCVNRIPLIKWMAVVLHAKLVEYLIKEVANVNNVLPIQN